MSRIIDLAGERFGKWTVLEKRNKATSGNYKWLCRCSCGNEVEVDGNSLRSGKSTGCRRCAVPHNRTKYTGDPIQTIWAGMKQRCYDPNQNRYNIYGGRGILIYQKWLDDPTKFYEWAYSNGYKEGLSIERVDNDKGYIPSNCKFIPLSKQAENRRTNNYIELNGKTKTLSKWCRDLGMNRGTVRGRLRRGWTVEEAFYIPVGKKREDS